MKEVAAKTTGSTYTAEEFTDGVSQESQNLVKNTSQTLTNLDLNQTTQAVSRLSSTKFQYIDAGSTPDTYVLTSGNPFAGNTQLSAYVESMTVSFQVPLNNTGPATLNVDSLGVSPLLDMAGAPLVADYLVAGTYVTAIRVGSDFVVARQDSQDEALRAILQGTGGADYVNTANGNSVQTELDTIAERGIKAAGSVLVGGLANNFNIVGFSGTGTASNFTYDITISEPSSFLIGAACINNDSLPGGAIGWMVPSITFDTPTTLRIRTYTFTGAAPLIEAPNNLSFNFIII